MQIGVGTEIVTGDLDGSGVIDALDIDLLAAATRTGTNTYFDLNSDGRLDSLDHRFLVYDILGTTFGDANLDGRFNSADLVLIFQAGSDEKAASEDTGWRQGDWNADGRFDAFDLVAAFQSERYFAASIQ